MFLHSKKKKTLSTLDKLKKDGFLSDYDCDKVSDELLEELRDEFLSNNIKLDQLLFDLRDNKGFEIRKNEINMLFFREVTNFSF